MKAVVFHGIGDIRLQDVSEPELQEPTDAIVRITSSAICGTDLHMVRGTFTGMESGTILGHEGVGVVEKLGPMVRNFDVGDRVVILSTIAWVTAPTAALAILPNAITQIRKANGQAPPSSAVRGRPVHSTDFRPRRRVSPTRTLAW
jgi:NADPH:quinone reductase-like Zn-dependent oxidoreductase